MNNKIITILLIMAGLIYGIPTICTIATSGFYDLPLLWSLITICLIGLPFYLAIALLFFPPAWIVLAWLLFWKTKPVR